MTDLLKKLIHVKRVRGNVDNIRHIINILTEDNFSIVNAGRFHHRYYRDDGSGKYKWRDPNVDEIKEPSNYVTYFSTYANYIKFELVLRYNYIVGCIEIYDHHYDKAKTLRWSFDVVLTEEQLELFADQINNEFSNELADDYETYLEKKQEQKKKLWMEKQATKILSQTTLREVDH